MTDDDKTLVERLRDSFEYDRSHYAPDPLVAEAADRIEALSAEKQAARMDERAAVVDWLRENSTPHNDIDEWADEIEAGVHLK